MFYTTSAKFRGVAFGLYFRSLYSEILLVIHQFLAGMCATTPPPPPPSLTDAKILRVVDINNNI